MAKVRAEEEEKNSVPNSNRMMDYFDYIDLMWETLPKDKRSKQYKEHVKKYNLAVDKANALSGKGGKLFNKL